MRGGGGRGEESRNGWELKQVKAWRLSLLSEHKNLFLFVTSKAKVIEQWEGVKGKGAHCEIWGKSLTGRGCQTFWRSFLNRRFCDGGIEKMEIQYFVPLLLIYISTHEVTDTCSCPSRSEEKSFSMLRQLASESRIKLLFMRLNEWLSQRVANRKRKRNVWYRITRKSIMFSVTFSSDSIVE